MKKNNKEEPNIMIDVLGQSEDALQQKCIFWFNRQYRELRGLLFHVPNGGTRSKREAYKFKQIGLVPGVSDLIFLYKRKCYLIELKTMHGVQSRKQKLWADKVWVQGFEYEVIRSLREFQSLIRNIMYLEDNS